MTPSKAAGIIKKLLGTTGRTPAESATFAAKAQELLTKYELSMDDVAYEALSVDDPQGVTRVKLTPWDDRKQIFKFFSVSGRQRVEWIQSLAHWIADANFCRLLVYNGSADIGFIGRESHREVCEFLLVSLLRQLDDAARVAYNEARRKAKARDRDGISYRTSGFIASFRRSFVETIRERLAEKRSAMEEDARAEAEAFAEDNELDASMALVRLDRAEEAVQKYMDDKLNLVSSAGLRGSWGGNSGGRSAGSSAGDQANINSGVGRGGGGPRLLGSGG